MKRKAKRTAKPKLKGGALTSQKVLKAVGKIVQGVAPIVAKELLKGRGLNPGGGTLKLAGQGKRRKKCGGCS